jgi:late competence protein required for DNA uptake (superfamily II DNA/RNA helicase)
MVEARNGKVTKGSAELFERVYSTQAPAGVGEMVYANIGTSLAAGASVTVAGRAALMATAVDVVLQQIPDFFETFSTTSVR